MAQLDASIIIPTYNRKDSLLLTLNSLRSQTWPHNLFEVIVVDDGSVENLDSVEEEDFPFPFRMIHQINQGSAAARNTGAQNSNGQLLIFIDDDILLEPGYIEGLIKEHWAYKNIVGMGICLPYITSRSTCFERIYLANLFTLELVSKEVQFTECVTNNLSVMRGDFEQVGEMQDIAGDGPTWWGDVDFGYRAWKIGMHFRRSGSAICYHVDYSTQSLASVSQRAYKISQMAVVLLRKYPDILSYLPMFADKTPLQPLQEPIRLTVRKILRSFSAGTLPVNVLEFSARVLEMSMPIPFVLTPIYRWIIGAYIYRGFRDGFLRYQSPTI
ncbi:MAG TPA: glycosyltransferase [Anaerolineales bacterium]|nr:glycosyltransferase [Anaerolineales bacterium]